MQILPASPNARLKCVRAACPLKRSVWMRGNRVNRAGKSFGVGSEMLPSKLPVRSQAFKASHKPMPFDKSVLILSAYPSGVRPAAKISNTIFQNWLCLYA